MTCLHPHLVRVIVEGDPSAPSTTYKCQGECGRMFTVALVPYQIKVIEPASPDGAA